MKRISIYINEDLAEKAMEEAKKRGLRGGRSELVEIALKKEMAKDE